MTWAFALPSLSDIVNANLSSYTASMLMLEMNSE